LPDNDGKLKKLILRIKNMLPESDRNASKALTENRGYENDL